MFASAYDHKADDAVAVQDSNSPWVTKKQPKKCRDPIFAVLLYANVAAIIGVYAKYGTNILVDDADAAEADDALVNTDFTPIIYTAGALAGFSLVLSAIFMNILMCIPGFLIKAALFFNIGLCAVAVAVAFYYGSLILGAIAAVFLALTLCYAKMVWSRIPFATANLKTGTSAIRANAGIILMAYVFPVFAAGWTILWSLAVTGIQDTLITCSEVEGETVCTDPNYGIWFVLFVSFFFTHQVLQNCVHCAVSGVVGSWWFTPSANGCCSSAVLGSFVRTMTTSFGSICFGSLLVAIIQAIRQLAEQARQNDEIGQTLACCIDCILGCLESLLEYFNKWAFVYVGVYGYGYCEAGKAVMQLFKDRGWEAVIADDLVGMALFMSSLVVGLISAGVGALIVEVSPWWDEFIIAMGDDTAKIIAAVLGFIIGLVLCSVVMSVIASSVNAAIVLFADAPAEFEQNYPELSGEMREAYQVAHPGSIQ
mmetsp:Transcript_25256/g.37419  ORF Transcript_25256/g.37419 Transcript_25256/m.37419 type:complete len:481 (-) Transcript_25256:216-1658(-)